MTRRSRSTAGADVVAASEQLMAGLLEEEERCFTRMADGLAVIAGELAKRLEARSANGGEDALWRGREGLLPALLRFEGLLMPPIGDLLATVRQRTLVVVRRQMNAAESTLGAEWSGLGAQATSVARDQAGRLETHWYQRANEGLEAAVVSMRGDMLTQAGIWHGRREPAGHLVRRWTQLDPLYLTGSHSRGVVWLVRATMNAHARNASVALANGLVLAGVDAYNVVTGAVAAS